MQDDVCMGWENQRHRPREASTFRWPRLRFQRPSSFVTYTARVSKLEGGL